MDDAPEEVIRHYESIDEDERITEGMGRLELLRTQAILRRHLPAPGARILDVGGATGVHARWLAEDGYDVHVIDVVPSHVEAVRRLASHRGSITAELGDARRLAVADGQFDVVLLLGPLYHLVDRDDRLRALREAARAVRPGGLVVAAAISRFASLFDGLARGFLFDPEFRSIVESDLHDGQHRNPEHRPHWFTTAYFHHPNGLRAEVADAGLEVVDVLGVEGLAGWLPNLADRLDDDGDRETILYSARATERDPAVLGLSAHLLIVARRGG